MNDIPPQPSGDDAESRFMKWAWKSIIDQGKLLSALLRPPPPSARSEFHPFKIYNFPKTLRKFQNDTDWRRLKVHNGHVIMAGAGQAGVYGTDRFPKKFDPQILSERDVIDREVLPDDDTTIDVPPIGFWHEVIVPDDGDTCYFWISLALGGAGVAVPWNPQVCFGKTPDETLTLFTGETVIDPWPDFPFEDPYHKIIGRVKIVADRDLRIYQDLNHDWDVSDYFGVGTTDEPLAGTRQRYCGDYSATRYYWVGDTVTQAAEEDGGTFLYQWVYWPPHLSIYHPYETYCGPILNVPPSTDFAVADPWKMLSRSPITGTWATGAYDAARHYFKY